MIEDIKAFVEDYYQYAVKNSGVTLLRWDLFTAKDGRGTIRFLVQDGEQKCLLNEDMQELCKADGITPLYARVYEPGLDAFVRKFFATHGAIRDTICDCDMAVALNAMQQAASFPDALSTAYLVEQKGKSGVISIDGATIVPVEYSTIRPFSFTKDLYYMVDPDMVADVFGGKTDAYTALYLAIKDPSVPNTMAVFDPAANLIFNRIDQFYPCEELVKTPPFGMCEEMLPRQKNIISFWCSTKEGDDYTHTKYFVDQLYDPPAEDKLLLHRIEAIPDTWEWLNIDGPCPLESTDRVNGIFVSMARTLGEHLQESTDTVLSNIGCWRWFRNIKVPLEASLDSPIEVLDLPVGSQRIIQRYGILTIGDFHNFEPERFGKLRGMGHFLDIVLCAHKRVRNTFEGR